MPYIDIRLNFEVKYDLEWDDYKLVSVQQVDSDIPEEARDDIAEWAGQSDDWHVEAVNAIGYALGNTDVHEVG